MMNNINPMQLIGMIKNANNPQQLMIDLMQNNCNANPMIRNAMANLISMVQQNDSAGVERMARNLAKERGVNPDEMIQNIRKQLGM